MKEINICIDIDECTNRDACPENANCENSQLD